MKLINMKNGLLVRMRRTPIHHTYHTSRPSMDHGFNLFSSPLNLVATVSLRQTQKAQFSSSTSTPLSKIDKRLASLLREEHTFETGSSSKEPEHISSFLKKSGWNIEDRSNCMEIFLRKTIGSEEIMVTFSASQIDQSEINLEEEEEETDAQGIYQGEQVGSVSQGFQSRGQNEGMEDIAQNDEDDGSAYEMDELNFAVVIKKQTEKDALIFDCVAINDNVEIESVQYIPDSSLINVSDAKIIHDRSNSYPGPIISTLDDKVQDGLLDYLEVRGIGEDLAIFIRDYVAFKEQNEYIRWLKNVQNFIAGRH